MDLLIFPVITDITLKAVKNKFISDMNFASLGFATGF